MATPPVFSAGAVLTAAQMNAVGLWKVTPSSVTNGTVNSDGSVTIGNAVASITVNGAFSSDFENYKIILNGGTSNTAQAITMQLGASTASYSYNTLIYNYSTGGATVLNGNAQTKFEYVGEANTNFLNICIDILSPNLSKYTTIQGSYIGENSGGTASGVHKVNTAYTSFIFAVAGTMTGGTIHIFGYN